MVLHPPNDALPGMGLPAHAPAAGMALVSERCGRREATFNGRVKRAGSANDRDPVLVNIGGSVPTAVRTQHLPWAGRGATTDRWLK